MTRKTLFPGGSGLGLLVALAGYAGKFMGEEFLHPRISAGWFQEIVAADGSRR